jgi:hypothetical protein
MGRGRPAKSVEHHLAKGTYRPSRHGPLPATPAPAVIQTPVSVPASGGPPPERPGELTGRAAEWWDQYTRQLGGLVRETDTAALAELCRWVTRSELIAARLDAMDPAAREYKALIVSAGIATDKVATLGARFGLTPADRAKGKVAAPPPAEGAGPAKPKVRARPQTGIDREGKPT